MDVYSPMIFRRIQEANQKYKTKHKQNSDKQNRPSHSWKFHNLHYSWSRMQRNTTSYRSKILPSSYHSKVNKKELCEHKIHTCTITDVITRDKSWNSKNDSSDFWPWLIHNHDITAISEADNASHLAYLSIMYLCALKVWINKRESLQVIC